MTPECSMKTNLAIYGGTPVRAEPMPPRIALGKAERAMIDEVLDHYAALGLDPGYQGEFETRYCEAFAAHLGGGFADAVATGTAALFVALAALELKAGSEVLVSPITDPGTLAAIILTGGTPRLVDSRPGSFNIGIEEVSARVSEKCSALVVVHAAGRPVTDIAAMVEYCHERGIRVLEDCSQAHGARVDGRPVGVFGDIAAFSTMYRKAHMTGGSGGVVFSTDERLSQLALAHADRGKARWLDGFDDRNPNTFLFPALNLHTNEISCAIGLASLRRLEDSIARRMRFISGVSERIEAESRSCSPYGYGDGDSPFYYPVFVDGGAISVSKTEFAEALLAEGIGLNPHYQYVVSEWPWISSLLADDFPTPNAMDARDSSFALYVNENYGQREIDDTVSAIRKVEDAF
jgi:perosamine synthetase